MVVSRCCKDEVFLYSCEGKDYYVCVHCTLPCDTILFDKTYKDVSNAKIQPGVIL